LINPLGAMPVFITLTSGFTNELRAQTIRRTAFYVFAVCLVSYFIGSYILDFFGVSIHALKFAGGLVISRSGFLLLNAQHKKDVKGKVEEESRSKDDISFSPLAMPLLSGPGSMSLLINLSLQTQSWVDKIVVILSIFTVSLAIYLIFLLAPRILKYMGEAGIRSMSKIMGFIVLAIGVQMMVDSIKLLLELN
jgi:multiple antibiotic resistance protein